MPPRLANVWFGPSEVSTANCIGVLSNSVSRYITQLIQFKFVTNTSELFSLIVKFSNQLYRIGIFLIFQVGVGLGFLIPSYVLAPNGSLSEHKTGLDILNWSSMVLNTVIFLATTVCKDSHSLISYDFYVPAAAQSSELKIRSKFCKSYI